MAFKFTEEQLNTLDKSFVVNLFLQLQDQNDKLSGEVQELNKKMEVLIEQITLANKNRFGRSSEKMTDTSQICFMEVDGTIVFFNEAEAIYDLDAEEPDTLQNKPARILSLWSCHYTSKHGKLDDSIRRKLPGCVV